jgi:glycosyltransferase involved in cell wall biosynthesis/ADP-heptose:LPS heptosyltransferase
MKIFALVTDAFGGQGGIAKFNRDLLSALCGQPEVEKVVAIPRLIPESPGKLPEKLEFVAGSAGGKIRFALAVLKSAIANRESQIILCGHINLLPLAFIARWFCRAPIVLVVHGIDAWQPTGSWLVNRLVRKIDAVVAVSDFTRQKFLAWAQPEHAREFILPNCVDLAQFAPGPKDTALLDRYGLRDRTVLLTVARLSAQEKYKGIDEVLEVLPALAQQIPNVSYLIVGDGSDRARLAAKAAQLGVAERVVFAGWIPGAETVAHYRLADAFVMPGHGEGFGIVYLEALASGVPVLASTADASAEVVRDCELATVAPPDRPDEIRAGIFRALKMSRGAVPARVREFSTEKFNDRCAKIFAALGGPGNVLVFRIGQLGDTIVALPAMRAVRQHFPAARLTLLCDRHPGKPRVLAADLLRGAGLFEAFESYVVDASLAGRLLRPLRMAALARRLRRLRFDTLVYLAPSNRAPGQMARDRKFFALAGIQNFIGLKGFPELPRKVPGRPLDGTLAEADLLLARLAADGIPVPGAGRGAMDLGLGAVEEAEVAAWRARLPADGGRRWVGIGPGSKMPAKRWPEERYREVVAGLIAAADVWPVIFGGPEDRAVGERLLAAWGRGYNAAGELSLRGSPAALRHCRIYLGNDTGTMHLAAAAGVPCVAVFSAREWPGMWYPYGVPQRVFRTAIECEGCALEVCTEKQNECLTRIQPAAVLAACRELLRAAEPPGAAEI